MANNYYGILPLDFGRQSERIAPKPDPRIAASDLHYATFLCRLAKERPELIDRFFIDEQRLTMH
jgi:hypothetical protein